MATFNRGDGALLTFHEQIKDALDPNGIIAPDGVGTLHAGRGGIRHELACALDWRGLFERASAHG